MQIITYHLLKQFREIFDGDPWMGDSLTKKIDSLEEKVLFTQPNGLHSVAEIISHLIEWRKEIFNRLKGYPRKMNVDSNENWIPNKKLQNKGWAALWADFQQSQEELYALLEIKDDYFLAEPYVDESNEYLVRGLLHHDIYHLGQIGIIARLATEQNPNVK